QSRQNAPWRTQPMSDALSFFNFDPTLRTIDKAGTFERLHAAFIEDLKPVGALEISLVVRLALLTLRQQRVIRFEHGILSDRVQGAHERGWERIQSHRSAKNSLRSMLQVLEDGYPSDAEIPQDVAADLLRI